MDIFLNYSKIFFKKYIDLLDRVPHSYFYTGVIVMGLCLLGNLLLFQKSDNENQADGKNVDIDENRALINDEVISNQYTETISNSAEDNFSK